jgi:hypothetical protein
MFEMYSFFRICILKFVKSAIMTRKKFFVKYINVVSKTAEFYADFKFFDADLTNSPEKS